MEEEKNFETNAIRAQHERSAFREHSVPLYLTSSFVFDDAEQARAMFADEISGNIYSRYSNPNTGEFIPSFASWKVPKTESPRPPEWLPCTAVWPLC
jgi:O-acetylhomoserine/O-acetylserine sulfhydrylase-like pyridoxal-dependent enzyme